MEVLAVWLLLAFVVALLWGAKGRSMFWGFVLSALLSPVAGLLIWLLLGSKQQVVIIREVEKRR